MKKKSATHRLVIGVMWAAGILGVAFAVPSGRRETVRPQIVPIPPTNCIDSGDCAHIGMVGITRGQTARLNVHGDKSTVDNPVDISTLDNVTDVSPGPCREVELMFFDSQGNIRQRSVQCIMPGQAAFLDLNGSFLEVPGQRAEIRASARLISPLPNGDRNRINLISTLEVFDNETGRTSVVLAPPPDPDKK